MVLVEAAIDSVADAERAVAEGATRLEVCSLLDEGGLTPSAELLASCVALGVPCVAMARPRPGGFHYDRVELRQLLAAAEDALELGADGVVFGALESNGHVNAALVRQIVESCRDAETVFHRAFDQTPNVIDALDVLIQRGVTRVLTSGYAPDAITGVETLASLVQRAAGRIQILPGGGVRAANVRSIVQRSGVQQVHARATEPGVIAAIVRTLRSS